MHERHNPGGFRMRLPDRFMPAAGLAHGPVAWLRPNDAPRAEHAAPAWSFGRGTVPSTASATEPSVWVALTDASDAAAPPAVSRGRVLAPIAFGALAMLIVVMVSGAFAASRLAEKEAVHDAARRADVVADTVIQPALTDALVSGDPTAFAVMDRAVRAHVLDDLSQRVKIWTPQGRVVYSDEPALVGKVFPLPDDERQVLSHPTTRAEVSALHGEENAFERRLGPRLLEVYRPVWTPSGAPLLFETYASYDQVGARTGQLWRGFAGITLSSLLALVVLIVPVLWQLLSRVRRHQDQREALLTRAVEASTDERRRIAGTLHDGVIQELTGASFVVSSAAARATAVDQPDLASVLRDAAATVRKSITGMRSLLVDIYPPNLRTSGLVPALDDLATSLRSREVEVSFDLAPDVVIDLDSTTERLIYRVVHECLHNTMQHALAKHATITVTRQPEATVLSVHDDGIGFEPTEVLHDGNRNCMGLRALVDDVRNAGSELFLSTAPGAGTHWLLRVPRQSHPDEIAPSRVRRPRHAQPPPDRAGNTGDRPMAREQPRGSATSRSSTPFRGNRWRPFSKRRGRERQS